MENMFSFIFDNDNINIDFDANGFAWFRAPEIARVLEYRDAYNMCRMLPDNEKGTHKVSTLGGIQEMTIISESGLYRCIFNSRSPKAIEFQNKVFNEVLPCIRQYGAFIDESTRIALNNNPNLVHELTSQIEHMKTLKPMCHIIDTTRYPFRSFEELQRFKRENWSFINLGKICAANENLTTINELAKTIQNILPFNFGEHELRAHLREDGFLMRSRLNYNHPTDYSIDNGLMVLVPGTSQDTYITMITPKGLRYFIEYFSNKFNNQGK